MPRTTNLPKLYLTEEQRNYLKKISQSRTAPMRELQRAQILLEYVGDTSISDIKSSVYVSRPTIYKCIDKALSMGIESGLKDKYHSPKEPIITE